MGCRRRSACVGAWRASPPLWRDDLPTSGPVDLPLSQVELASMVGLSRQRLSTLLGRLAAQGLIEVGFRNIRVLG